MIKSTKSMIRFAPIGVIVSAVLMAGCVAPAGAGSANGGVAANNMSDAARAARLSAAASTGVAANNMSDAVRSARLSAQAGVAVNNMSDAARAATLTHQREFGDR